MSTNRKRIFAAALFLGALAVWVPQIAGRGGAAPGEPFLDADLGSSAELGPGLRLYTGGGAPPAEGAEPDGTELARPGPAAVAPPRAGDGAAPPVQNFSGAPRDELLARLASAWGGASPPSAPATRGERAPSGSPPDVLEDLLARTPLGGILRAQDRALALFGPRVVREGEELVPGRVVVRAIGRRHVDLEVDGVVSRVELPAVGVRAGRSAPSTAPGAAAAARPDADPSSEEGADPDPPERSQAP